MKETTEQRTRTWTRPGGEFEEYERSDGTHFVRERRLDSYGMLGEWRVTSDSKRILLPTPRKRPQLDIALADVAEVFAAIDDALVSVRALSVGTVRTRLENQLDNQRLCLEEVVGEVAQLQRELREGAQEDAWDAARDEKFLAARRGGE